MAVMLYKKGDSHEIRGVKCEMQKFSVSSLESALASGWVTDPNDIKRPGRKPKVQTESTESDDKQD